MKSGLFYLLTILAVLQFRGDGYFPFDRNWNAGLLLAIALAHLLVIWGLLAGLTKVWVGDAEHRPDWAAKLLPWVAPVFSLVVVLGHAMQASRFTGFGYQWKPGFLGLLLVVSANLQFLAWRAWKREQTLVALALSWGGALALKLYPLWAYPVTAKRSDMLPIIFEAGQAWLAGQPVYQYFLLDNGISTQMVRLPGMIAVFLPAVGLGLDLRWVLLLFESGLALALAWAIAQMAPAKRPSFALLWLALAYLPYWHMRHELYEVPFWLLLLLAVFWLRQGRLWAGAAVLGYLAGMHQWAWILAPYLGLYLWRKEGPRRSLLAGCLAAAVGFLVLAAGVQGDWASWQHHIFSYYDQFLASGKPYPMALYWTALLSQFGGLSLLKPIQVAGLLGLLLWSMKRPAALEEALFASGLALSWMLAFNAVAWTYQYLLVVFLLSLAWGFRSSRPD